MAVRCASSNGASSGGSIVVHDHRVKSSSTRSSSNSRDSDSSQPARETTQQGFQRQAGGVAGAASVEKTATFALRRRPACRLCSALAPNL